MDQISEFKQQIRMLLNASFPAYTIVFETIGDDPFHLGVGVFGVEKSLVHWVEDRVLELDARFCENTEFALTPMVRDLQATEKHYPHLLSPWKRLTEFFTTEETSCANESEIVSPALLMVEAATAEWDLPAAIDMAANKELALAA